MQPGSIIERIPGFKFRFLDRNGQQFPPWVIEVPISVPVVLESWKYAGKQDTAFIYLFIEGYCDFAVNEEIYRICYDHRGFRQLQSPMDLSFVEEMQTYKKNTEPSRILTRQPSKIFTAPIINQLYGTVR